MCCGGDGGGQRPLEQEEKDLLRMQTLTAQQGLEGRGQAMEGYTELRDRGKAMGSLANQEKEGNRALQDAETTFANANRMRDTQLESMGVNPGDARFNRGRDTDNVRAVAAAATGANAARTNVRREGLGLEAAGLAGLSGFDPSNALNSMAGTIGNAQRTAAGISAANAQGWGNLASAGMYGLANGDKIGSSLSSMGKTVSGWMNSGSTSDVAIANSGVGGWADGGEVPEYAQGGLIRRFASGGNVYDNPNGGQPNAYDQASMGMDGQATAIRDNTPVQAPAPGVDPGTAMSAAKFAVDKTAQAMGLGAKAGATPESLNMANKIGEMGGDSMKALIDANGGWSGVGTGTAATTGTGTAAAGATEAAAATTAGEAAAGSTMAGGLGAAGAALGAAIPWVGAAMLVGKALGLKDGGGVPSQAHSGIDRKKVAGRAENPRGGKVSGPGGPKDDKVMARLSPGEFVMPVGTVRKFGIDRLEKMRQAGLEFERQNGIH